MKSVFVSTASHELRTPLSAILGYADMLQEGIHGPLSEKQHGILKRIVANTGQLLGIVNNLLDQAQIEAGTLTLNVISFTLADLIDGVQGVMDVLAQSKGLKLTNYIADDLPETLFGDHQRLRQILINLVGNAVKFTDEGTVHMDAHRLDSDRWALEVSDTGHGIPTEAQSYIFEPFRQADDSPTREHTGTGLGLSIVKQLIELMDGEITLESKKGHGSTFTVVLPLVPPNWNANSKSLSQG
jgi:signal transduction histidine kinase